MLTSGQPLILIVIHPPLKANPGSDEVPIPFQGELNHEHLSVGSCRLRKPFSPQLRHALSPRGHLREKDAP